jgi:iron complex outermembrane receptor protein
LTSITGFREVKTNTYAEFDGAQTDQSVFVANGLPDSSVIPPQIPIQGDLQHLDTDQRFWSEELRAAGNYSGWDWLFGAYGFKQEQDNFAEQAAGPGVIADPSISFLVPLVDREDFAANRKGWALFGQLSWRPIERLELTGGARYSRETAAIDGYFFINFAQIANTNPTFFTASASKTFSNVSPMGSVLWRLATNVKGYATISKGWKAGGFNRYPSAAAAAVIPYDAENSVNYELGLKSAWPDNRVTANVAVFYIDLSSQQLFTTTNAPNTGVPVSTIVNAGKSRSQGAEFELGAQPLDRLKLSLSLAYTDTKFINFTEFASDGSFVVRDGQRFEFVPLLTGSVNAQYRFPIANEKNVVVGATYKYVDNYIVPDGAILAPLGGHLPVPSSSRVDLQALLSLREWKVSAYVRNVFDRFDYGNINYRPFLAEVPGNLLVTPLEPRTYGIVVSKTF